MFSSLLSLSEKAGVELDGGSYLIHKVYDDEETLSLVGAACETLGMHFTGNLFIFLRIIHTPERYFGSTAEERILESAILEELFHKSLSCSVAILVMICLSRSKCKIVDGTRNIENIN